MPNKQLPGSNPGPIAQRLFIACLCVFGGAVLLVLTVDVLTRIRGWLVAAAVVALVTYAARQVVRYRRDRW